MKINLATGTAAFLLVIGAIIFQHAMGGGRDDGRAENPTSTRSRTPDPDVSRVADRDLLERQAEEQAEQQQRALDDLAERTKERAEELRLTDPDR